MPPHNEFNLRELACVAQGGHWTGNCVKHCGRRSAESASMWREYQCVSCGVWVKDVHSIQAWDGLVLTQMLPNSDYIEHVH